MNPEDQCFDDGVNCDVTFDEEVSKSVEEPESVRVFAEVEKEANLGVNEEQTLEEKCLDDADACEVEEEPKIKEANLGKGDKLSQEEKCLDDADACEIDNEPVEKKIMKTKEANLGESDSKMDP